MKEQKLLSSEDFLKEMANIRKEHGVTINDISKQSGLTLNVISRMEATGKAPSEPVYNKYVKTVMKFTGYRYYIEERVQYPIQ